MPLDALLDRRDMRLPLVDGVLGRRPIRDPSPVALAAAPDGTFRIAGESGKGMMVPGWTSSDAYFARVDAEGTPLGAFTIDVGTIDVGGWAPVLALAHRGDALLAAGRTGELGLGRVGSRRTARRATSSPSATARTSRWP